MHSPEGGAKGNIAHENDVQQDERSGEEPVHIAGIVDAAQVAVRVCNVHAATMSALQRVLETLESPRRHQRPAVPPATAVSSARDACRRCSLAAHCSFSLNAIV